MDVRLDIRGLDMKALEAVAGLQDALYHHLLEAAEHELLDYEILVRDSIGHPAHAEYLVKCEDALVKLIRLKVRAVRRRVVAE